MLSRRKEERLTLRVAYSNNVLDKNKNKAIDHFTVVCLVAWSLNESEAGVDLVLMETSLLFLCKFLLISMRKAGRFLSKQGHLRPHFHSKARQLSKKL